MPKFVYIPTGAEYSSESPAEVTRLRMSHKYREVGVQVPVESTKDGEPQVFHPADHSVKEVQQYIKDHPEDADRVIAEELAAEQPRTTIVGD
jgi:uncharacterized phage protein gp47/JayE